MSKIIACPKWWKLLVKTTVTQQESNPVHRDHFIHCSRLSLMSFPNEDHSLIKFFWGTIFDWASDTYLYAQSRILHPILNQESRVCFTNHRMIMWKDETKLFSCGMMTVWRKFYISFIHTRKYKHFVNFLPGLV